MVVPGSIPNMMRSFAIFLMVIGCQLLVVSLIYFQILKFSNLQIQLPTFATMITIPHKAKQFGVFIIKLLIVTAAFYFIYDQLAHNDKLNWGEFTSLVKEKASFWGILFLLAFSFVNRFLEILKWQNLVSFLKPISLGESTKQVLGALTAGIFTPNGLGEYAGKALYFDKKKTKKIIFLNLICNGIQMILTIIFGTIGLFILGYWHWAMAITGLSIFFILFYSFYDASDV